LPLHTRVVIIEGRGDGEAGVIVKAGHGFYSVQLDASGELLQKRVTELDVDVSEDYVDTESISHTPLRPATVEADENVSVSSNQSNKSANRSSPQVSAIRRESKGSTVTGKARGGTVTPPPALQLDSMTDEELMTDESHLHVAAAILLDLMRSGSQPPTFKSVCATTTGSIDVVSSPPAPLAPRSPLLPRSISTSPVQPSVVAAALLSPKRTRADPVFFMPSVFDTVNVTVFGASQLA